MKIVAIDDMQFGFVPGKGTIDAVIILRREQEEYLAKQDELHMCYVDLAKAFDGVSRKVVEWAMRKKDIPEVVEWAMSMKGIPETFVTAVMSLCRGARTKVKVGTHFFEEFMVSVRIHQGSVLSPLLFAIVVDIAANEKKEGMLQEILYADDIVLIGESMEEQHENVMVGKVD